MRRLPKLSSSQQGPIRPIIIFCTVRALDDAIRRRSLLAQSTRPTRPTDSPVKLPCLQRLQLARRCRVACRTEDACTPEPPSDRTVTSASAPRSIADAKQPALPREIHAACHPIPTPSWRSSHTQPRPPAISRLGRQCHACSGRVSETRNTQGVSRNAATHLQAAACCARLAECRRSIAQHPSQRHGGPTDEPAPNQTLSLRVRVVLPLALKTGPAPISLQ